jgi:formylglycine-generating enzyme required for sulfatase activity
MFSRGIDPNVVDPTQCHSHPEVPPEWPTRAAIEDYVHKTKAKILTALAAGEICSRLAILAIEHEYMHLETLAYMRAQERKVTFEKKMLSIATPPPHHANGTSKSLAKPRSHRSYTNGKVHNVDEEEEQKREESKMVEIAPGKVTLGGDPSQGTFMWDNEYPMLVTTVREPFRVSCKPVTVAEFLAFVKGGGYQEAKLWKPLDFAFFQRQKITKPATWSEIEGEYYVHSAAATHHWAKVASEPVYASLSEAEAFCAWSRGRVMTEPEYHRILASEEGARVETLRSGGWEWTSSPFEPFPGFAKMPEYPEYSSDFFDGSHFVLKGASPLTHRCLWRDTFRNFYQRQYPYVFAKFRVCKSTIA